MKQSKLEIFTQFIAGIVGGGILGSIGGFGLLLALFGFDTPTYGIVIILGTCSIGAYIGISLAKKTNMKPKNILISLGLLILIPLIAGLLAFGPGFEDIDFIGMILLNAVIFTVIPSLIITMAINWQKFFKKQDF
ncbi:MAG: hypothetical protein HYV33_04000 [Candidatus Kerfeldbacteria bacterium]|nr:hypothetical protein [Candidatus Kerfeldbacteria bacterium]